MKSARLIDLTGQRFGTLLVTGRPDEPRDKRGLARWVCHCDCGNIRITTGVNLRQGRTICCGATIHKIKDITGQRFGQLQVLDQEVRLKPRRSVRWRCRCDCGAITWVNGTLLRRGDTRSCGCLQRSIAAEGLSQRGGVMQRPSAEKSRPKQKQPQVKGPRIAMIGKRFGHLVVEKLAAKQIRYEYYWECRCDCGGQATVSGTHLRSGQTSSCGCLRTGIPAADHTGRRYERLVVLSPAGLDRRGNACWSCRCDCGNTVIIAGTQLRRGKVKSCGCLIAEILRAKQQPIDLAGKRFGRLEVLGPEGHDDKGCALWRCRCDCGTTNVAKGPNLRRGRTQSCGCVIKRKGRPPGSRWSNQGHHKK